MTYFAGRRDRLSTYRQECKMTVLRSQVWLLAVRRAVFSCPNLSLSGVYKKTPEGLWASRQATGWFEVSSGKETLRLVTDSTAKPNLVQKQVDMSALYRILKLAIVVTSNCQHFNKKKNLKKWTHVNETPLASTSTWLAVMGGNTLRSQQLIHRAEQWTVPGSWARIDRARKMNDIGGGRDSIRQATQRGFPPPSSHLRRAAAKVTKKKVKRKRKILPPQYSVTSALQANVSRRNR